MHRVSQIQFKSGPLRTVYLPITAAQANILYTHGIHIFQTCDEAQTWLHKNRTPWHALTLATIAETGDSFCLIGYAA